MRFVFVAKLSAWVEWARCGALACRPVEQARCLAVLALKGYSHCRPCMDVAATAPPRPPPLLAGSQSGKTSQTITISDW